MALVDPDHQPGAESPRKEWRQQVRELLAQYEQQLTPGRLRALQWSFGAFAALTVLLVAVFGYFYFQYARRIDHLLAAGPFAGTMNIYAAPRTIAAGDTGTPELVVEELRRSGYGDSRNHPSGWYARAGNKVEIHPGPDSPSEHRAAVLTFAKGKISRVESLPGGKDLSGYQLQPQLIANISDENRERRRLVSFAEIPKSLVHAVVAVEDKRFFQHSGFDAIRILKAAYVDLREGRKEQGASTLSMQLARNLWLTSDKRFQRKMAELLIAMRLESRLSKEQIFEYYANQVYLGRRGTFNIHGFGEGARAFFGKEIGQLTVPEAALLAGIIQRPSYYNPLRYPERAKERRNLVLRLMQDNGYLDPAAYRAALEAPVALSPVYEELLDSQYYVDLVSDEINDKLPDEESRSGSVYTSLDLRLQRAAEEAIQAGMKRVDRLTRKQSGQAEVALVALDPRTGEIKALAGGRNYAMSQLNRVLARRQPGSVFKPFVFAAAVDTAVEGGANLLTPASTVMDEPTTWFFNHQTYQPKNFGGSFQGEVTLRRSLVHSLNIPTIKVAEMVGYNRVVDIARRAGFGNGIQATPAVALGAYEATPLEVAGAYTVFANTGKYVRPAFVRSVRGRGGEVTYTHTPESHAALDPRVSYLVTDMMQDVVNRGTGAAVRQMGFRAPAAGKTGTSRDGWFAGFTTELICVVWVGFDDNRELGLEGSKSALPIWTEFMKRAHQVREYDHPRNFEVPKGLVRVAVDPDTGLLAGPECPTSQEYFIKGTEPAIQCSHFAPQVQTFGVADRDSTAAGQFTPTAQP